ELGGRGGAELRAELAVRRGDVDLVETLVGTAEVVVLLDVAAGREIPHAGVGRLGVVAALEEEPAARVEEEHVGRAVRQARAVDLDALGPAAETGPLIHDAAAGPQHRL